MPDFQIVRLSPGDLTGLRALMALFSEAFGDPETYAAARPGEAYLSDLLARPDFIALSAWRGGVIAGGLTAYVLGKPEQERAEIYIYDLAVAEAQRRRGIATALIGELKQLAPRYGAWVIYVQADYEDPPAIALYEKLGRREEVLHFDIGISPTSR